MNPDPNHFSGEGDGEIYLLTNMVLQWLKIYLLHNGDKKSDAAKGRREHE